MKPRMKPRGVIFILECILLVVLISPLFLSYQEMYGEGKAIHPNNLYINFINPLFQSGIPYWQGRYYIGSSQERIIEEVDNSAPIISLLDPANGHTDKTGKVVFEYIVKDYSYDIANCSLIFNGKTNQTDSTITELELQNFTINNLTYGSYEWSVNCIDSSPNANQGASHTSEVIVNKEPKVILNAPLYGSEDNDGDIIFNFTVKDDGLLRNCTLYHNISGSWLSNQSNTFVQPDTSLYFTIKNAPDGYYGWNVICYDDARYPNFGWGGWGRYSNFLINVNKTAPQVSTIPSLFWKEDDILVLNLSNYFFDPKGDNLMYNVQQSEHVNIAIDDKTSIAILESEKNWWGNVSAIFTAFDEHGMNISSNNVTFTVFEGSDTKPRFISIYPLNNSVDNDGYIFFTCNVTDDYALTNISLYSDTTYSDTTGDWALKETRKLTGLTDSAVFNITDLFDGYYKWACLAYDNASQQKWSDTYVVNVSIEVGIYHHIPSWMVNNVNTSRYIIISYSEYLNNSLDLGNLTIYEADGEIYYTKNMSNSPKFNGNSLIIHPQLINIIPSEIFDNNFSVGNTAGLNFSIKYYRQGKEYEAKENITIRAVDRTQW